MTDSANDCYHRALPGEPKFTLLARDPDFNRLVNEWANRRAADIRCGLRPDIDWGIVDEAQTIAADGEKWRKAHDGEWRK